MVNENLHTVTLKHSDMREVQLALLYHLDNVLIPYYEQISKERDYYPTMEVRKRIESLQRTLKYFNDVAGIYSETN